MDKTFCPQCGKGTSGRGKSGLCHVCAAKRAMNRPETNAKLHQPKNERARVNMKAAQQRPELRALHSALSSGEKNYFYGKPGTNRGKFGEAHPMFGRRFKKANPCNGINNPFYGRKHTVEARSNIAMNRTGKTIGADNPRWKSGIQPDRYERTFTDFIKNQVRERDGFTCRLCGKPEQKRHHHVHHIFYNRKDRELDKLITLCVPCHSLVHSQKKIWPSILTDKIAA